MSRYCVIGAGAAGLSAIHELTSAGHDVTCFEKTDRVGGHWHTDYDALHLITSREMTHFRDFPMPAEYPHFPRRDQVRDYIESFARAKDLLRWIRFETAVESVHPVPGAGRPGSRGWRVRASDGSEEVFDGVLVANGHLWDPSIPRVEGRFDGVQVHSGKYRNVGDLQGSRVLVVGAGNSGCDLAVDAAQHRLEVDVVMIQGLHFQPKSYFGVPRQEVGWLAQFSPDEQDLLNRLLSKLVLGEPTDYGMPPPDAPTLAAGATTVNSLLMYWIHHGRVGVKPGIERFDGHTVHFGDGTAAEYDNILWATGFNVRLPFLDDDLIPWERGVPLRRAGGILPEGVDNLYFVGLTAPRGPQIPIYGRQAALVAHMIALKEAGNAAVERTFEQLQDPDTRVDIVRTVWLEQMADTERILHAIAAVSAEPDEQVPA
ncbi:MAG TPA: NAD(P)-binding domain-containing protein [Actinokineospora sp.]|nr:NAD(P)-binding domain-containing protein [Actinokineospora sp.]